MKQFLSSTLILFIICFYTCLNAQNKMANNQSLDNKQQSIVRISALTATGNLEQLNIQLDEGLNNGLTTNEIKEVLVQLYAYCGFPRSLNGINTFIAVLESRKLKGISDPEGREVSDITETDKYQSGKKNLQMLTGREEKTLSGANAFAPAIDTFLKEHLFADIFNRDVLTFQQRELVTVAALAAMTGVAPQLQAHIGMAMNTGLLEMQFNEAFTIIDEIVGKNQGDIAREALQKVLASKSNK